MHFNAFSNAFGPRFQSLWSRIFQLKRNKNKLKTQENLFTTISTPLWVSSGGGTMFNVCINAKIIPDTDIPAIVVFFCLLFFIFFIIFFLFFYIFFYYFFYIIFFFFFYIFLYFFLLYFAHDHSRVTEQTYRYKFEIWKISSECSSTVAESDQFRNSALIVRKLYFFFFFFFFI